MILSFACCVCGVEDVLAVAPGHGSHAQIEMFGECVEVPSRAWCEACWRARFLSATAMRAEVRAP